jgi:hypothetical protein
MRIAFDLDGVLADFAGAYLDVERRLFGAEEAAADEDVPRPEEISAETATRRRVAIWHDIRSTVNFWTSLSPIDPDAVRRIHTLAIGRRWDIFFITQRPATAGETVQRQTQRWLATHGFDLPSVIVMPGSRGKVAGALHLDYLVDDTPKNCVDVLADSTTTPLLVLPSPDSAAAASARRLDIHVVCSISEALDVVEQGRPEPVATTLLQRIRRGIFS